MRSCVLIIVLLGGSPLPGEAQSSPAWTRSAVVAAALAHSPRLLAAGADTMAAQAGIVTAKSVPDPTLSASYTKDIPRYHVTAEMPLDDLWLRGLRVRTAETEATAVRYRVRYERAAVALEADTTYTRALAALARAAFSERNAADADSVRRMTESRRDAGDASDLDVELATLAAGQQANVAAADSVGAASLLMQVQSLIGLPTDRASLLPADTLTPPAADPDSTGEVASPLLIAGNRAALESAGLNLQLQHRSVLGSPGLIAGFDTGDPTGAEPGLLPTVGLSVPLPIFNRNRGPIAAAAADRDRAAAELQVAETESRVQISIARATLTAARSRMVRDQDLVRRAGRVATLALTAYREGAVPLANVLEAQRSARDVRNQYVDDVANILVADATLHLLTLTPAAP